MFNLSEISTHLLGFPTIREHFTVAGYGFMGLLATLALSVSFCWSVHRERIDRTLFWAFGVSLVVFLVLRPIGLARDDLAYVEITQDLCSDGECSKSMPITRDYVWYGLVKLGLPLVSEGFLAASALSGVGCLIKLFVLDRLCNERLLALLLLIPLSVVQYDLTQLRAGLASSWMMLGIFWLVRSQMWLGSAFLLSNFAVHSQAAFSPGILMYRLFGLSRWVLPVCILTLLGMTYGGVCPSVPTISGLGGVSVTAPYFAGIASEAYSRTRTLPFGYLPMLAYGVWFCSLAGEEHRRIANIVAASLCLGMVLAWFFAVIPVIQARLFEFYAVPLVLLAGNVGHSKLKITVTCFLAVALYLRLELLNDWVLG